MHPITEALLRWYDLNARVLPWRGIHDPYRTWVSEAMLQQTRVETVLSYYDAFLARFPTLESLAAASEAEVLKAWEGLGYYSRARNLWQGAQQVMREYGGKLPADPEALRGIHGIGPYTAGAIASIAFDIPVPAVDGNVIRVLSRVWGIRENPLAPAIHARIVELARELVPAERPGDHNQAVMDLGATVCVPGTPDCGRCPLSAFCDALRQGDAAELPRIPRGKPPRVICYDVPLIVSEGRVLMRQRTEKLLQGLWCFPLLEAPCAPDAARKKLHLPLDEGRELGEARHVFTHQVWQMRLLGFAPETPAAAPKGYAWIPAEELDTLAIPSAMSVPLAQARRLLEESRQ